MASEVVKPLSDYADSIDSSFWIHYDKIDPKLNWSWNKIAWLRDHMSHNSWEKIIVCDIDCLPLTLGKVPAPTHLERLWASRDNNGICCGFMVVPVNDFTRRLVDAWLLIGQMDEWSEFDGRDTWEQNSLKAMMKISPHIRMMVEEIAEKEVSNPETRGLTSLPILHHFWGNKGVDATVERIRRCKSDPVAYLKQEGIME